MATKLPDAGAYKNVTLRILPELKDKLIREAGKQSELRGETVSLNALVAELCEIGLAELAKQKRR